MSGLRPYRRKSFWRRGLLLIAAASPLGLFSQAHAASCCGGGSTSDSFVLSKMQKSLAGAAWSFQRDFDTRRSDGTRTHSDSWSNDEIRLGLGGSHRFTPDAQTGVSIPLVLRSVRAGSENEWGGGIGDAGLTARYEVMDDETCYMVPPRELRWNEMKPSIHWIARATVPTGRATPGSDDPLGAGITGRGLWSMESGIEIAKVWGRFGNGLDASTGVAYGAKSQRWALLTQAAVSAEYFLQYKHFAGIRVGYRREDAAGAQRPTSQQSTDIGLFHGITFGEQANWVARTSVGTAGLIQGRNTPVSASAAVTIGHTF